jgi:dTDP-4-dehydrorhamnose 3,5-epimerase
MPIEILPTAIAEIKLIKPQKIADARGFFSETYRRSELAAAGIDLDFVQENHSLSLHVGTIRGLHFQSPPCPQAKLVRVVQGRIFDVAVDLRRSSPTFGRHFTAELSAEDMQQLLIPVGFAHGFCTLEPNTSVVYKVSDYYSRANDHGLLWNDPALGIDWPVDENAAHLSERDKSHPRLHELAVLFD